MACSGDWASAVWSGTGVPGQAVSCAQQTGFSTCSAFVQASGGSFSQACKFRILSMFLSDIAHWLQTGKCPALRSTRTHHETFTTLEETQTCYRSIVVFTRMYIVALRLELHGHTRQAVVLSYRGVILQMSKPSLSQITM